MNRQEQIDRDQRLKAYSTQLAESNRQKQLEAKKLLWQKAMRSPEELTEDELMQLTKDERSQVYKNMVKSP